MSTTGTKIFDKTLQKSNEWLSDILDELQWQNREDALAILRAVLQTLRDRLPVDEAAQLSAQLPILLRGFYFENWNPSWRTTKERNKESFLETVRDHYRARDYIDLEKSVKVVLNVISKHVTDGEVRDIKGALPKSIQRFWEEDRERGSYRP